MLNFSKSLKDVAAVEISHMPQTAESYHTAIEILKDNHDKPVMPMMMLFEGLLSTERALESKESLPNLLNRAKVIYGH
jgi:Protein of unknown function (DUF1759)